MSEHDIDSLRDDNAVSETPAYNHLYRHFDAEGVLLYVGVSLNAFARLAKHRNCSHWFGLVRNMTIEDFPSREDSLRAETEAIRNERPLHNILKMGMGVPRKPPSFADISREEIIRRVTFAPVYSVKEAAQCLGVSGRCVRELIAAEEIGHFCIGNSAVRKPLISGWQIIDYLERIDPIAGMQGVPE
jgi:excisionase family DNA binding protein